MSEGPRTSAGAMSSASAVSQPRTRQELYDQIRASGGKEAFILQEMTRFGFWPREGELPDDPADEIRREGELKKQLAALRSEQSRLYNEERLLKELRKQRLKESREKKKATKERRLETRKQKAEDWKRQKAQNVFFLGDGFSGGLQEKTADTARLQAAGLPGFNDPFELATAMGISLGELRFLSFARKVSTTTHYKRFLLPKKSGGQRLISAPMPRLKEMQAWVATEILNKVDTHDCAHGFKTGRNIVSGASPHVGRDVVVNLDLENFFPTITYRRVKGVFRSLGYSEQNAIILGLLCTEPVAQEVELDGTTYYVARSERHLPQGAPSSPQLTNIICRNLDKRLIGLAAKLGFSYTRYADDLSFSASGDAATKVGKLLRKLKPIIEHEGFVIHPAKTRIMRRGRRQEVTGVVVNDRLAVERGRIRTFRAAVHHIKTKGLAGAHFGAARADEGHDVIAALDGFASFVHMVDPAKARKLWHSLYEATQAVGYRRPLVPDPPPPRPRTWSRYEPADEHQAGAASETPAAQPKKAAKEPDKKGDANKPWWKVW